MKSLLLYLFFSVAICAILHTQPDTLHFELTAGNNIVFKSILNEKDTVDLFLDTGGTELVLKHSVIKEKTALLEGQNENYREENYEPLEELSSLSLGAMRWDSLTIYPTTLLPKEADGHFGWNLFEGKVVELDYDKQLMIIHTSLPPALEGYAKLEIEYINTLFCINGKIQVGEKNYLGRYLFDTGFQRAVIMDKELKEESGFPSDLPVIKESRLRNSAGTEFVNQVVAVDEICFNQICASQVPVQLLSTPNPARFKTNILGNELLKRFNTYLDFQNHFVYLKPNSLMELAYEDASSN
ncbi:MAG: hypothetical protein AAGJ93_17295 [Bacteroidota bacterium]